MGSLFSFLAEKGHQPLVRFCLNRLMVGTEPSVLNMSREQRPALRAPRGNLVRSSVIAPRKSSLEKESASQTCKYYREVMGILLSLKAYKAAKSSNSN